jgi:hypothetical protein
MTINTARLEPDYPLPADLIWGQGPDFNNRLVQEINNEQTFLQFVIYRVTVDNITDALLAKFRSGVPMQLLIEPTEYLNRKWPEFYDPRQHRQALGGRHPDQVAHPQRPHAHEDAVTSTYATNASRITPRHGSATTTTSSPRPPSRRSSGDQEPRDRDVERHVGVCRIPAAAAGRARTGDAWVANATGVPTTTSLVWNIARSPSATTYLGTSQANMALVGNVPAQLVNNPPTTYSWTPSAALQAGTSYVWKVVSRTNATPVNASMVAASSVWAFSTAGSAGPPAAPANPTPRTLRQESARRRRWMVRRRSGHDLQRCVRHQQSTAAGGNRPDLALASPGTLGLDDLFLARDGGLERRQLLPAGCFARAVTV